MRIAVLVAVVALAAFGGCAAEQQRVEKEDRLSASRLSGRFQHDDPLVAMLKPSERDALARAGMMEARPEGEEGEDEETASPLDGEKKSGMDQAGDVMMSVLSVSLTLGMMAAPYLLF